MKQVPLDQYDATVSIEIAPTFVRIFAFKHLQTIIIDNPMIAMSLRQIFSMLWASIPDAHAPGKRATKRR